MLSTDDKAEETPKTEKKEENLVDKFTGALRLGLDALELFIPVTSRPSVGGGSGLRPGAAEASDSEDEDGSFDRQASAVFKIKVRPFQCCFLSFFSSIDAWWTD